MFRAILLNKNDDGSTRAELAQIDDAQLPADGDVTVAVDYSTINYKDGLALTGKAPVVRRFPMIPGIDFAGVVERSASPAFKPGDEVLLTGYGVGESHLGGFAQKARVKSDWLVPLPPGLTCAQAMAIGASSVCAACASRCTRSSGNRGVSQGTVSSSGVSQRSSPVRKPASGPAKPSSVSGQTAAPSDS